MVYYIPFPMFFSFVCLAHVVSRDREDVCERAVNKISRLEDFIGRLTTVDNSMWGVDGKHPSFNSNVCRRSGSK
jgi:hypothetical protein